MQPPAFDSSLYTDALFFLISIAFCGVFSFLETCVAALRLFKLKEMAQTTQRYKLLFHTLEHNPNRILIAILIAYNLAAVISTTLSDSFILHFTNALNFSPVVGKAIHIFVTTAAILVADLIPKSLATKHGTRLFGSALWMTNITYYVFYPFVTFLSGFTESIARKIAGPPNHETEAQDWGISEKEIQFLIDYINEKGLMERHKTAMLKSIFELGTTATKEVMIPENSVISINVESTQQEMLELFSKYQFTRIPVYEGEQDNIIGMILQKDFFLVLSSHQEKTLRDIVRPIMFIPESTKVLRAMKEFREQRMHIAMVINEFGGITGLVTLEDLIEEIVGEINDEYESVPEKIIPVKPSGWLVDASVELELLSEALQIEFEAEDALTLGGFLIEHFQHVPQRGEHLQYKKYDFQIQQSTPKRVIQVLVVKESPAHTHENEEHVTK